MRRGSQIVPLLIVGIGPLLAVGCLGEGVTPDDSGSVSTGPLLPWAGGNSWTYKVTGNDGTTTKVTTISDEPEPIGGGPFQDQLAYRVVTAKRDGAKETVSWRAVSGSDRVVRYREQTFSTEGDLKEERYWDPFRVYVDGSDEHTVKGARWTETAVESTIAVSANGVLRPPVDETITVEWQVVAVPEDRAAVTVPAGTFEDPLVFERVSGASVKTYWYVRGVGKVKETGGQTEELVEYQLAP